VRPGRAADHSPPSNAAVMEEYSYTSTHSLGHTGPVTGSLYLYLYIYIYVNNNTNIFHGRNNITCSTNCKYRTPATLYTPETWFVSNI